MTHTMLTDSLMEVRGAESETAARQYAERVSGRIIDSIVHIALSVYQVTLR